ncbi:NRAMP family divalent metal transporter [Segetibacter aerophilus]|uniref:Transporter n=1 Tax=Segetibacter aerophilus TaxID=670293 RepID=A0A512BHP6_9BACT|nr:NRAMP family divalent metal transporter [Segetibacter aerophilus]GEO11506.1 transporter [Segetibacter aerophilus]
MKKNSAILGAAFLMATSAIGPGFLTQTSKFTADLLASFGFVILISLLLDIGAQVNIWRVITVSNHRAQEVANKVFPGLGVALAALIGFGGLVFNIGNIAGCGLGINALTNLPTTSGAIVSCVIALGIFWYKEAGQLMDSFTKVLGILMIALTVYIAFVSRPPVAEALYRTVWPDKIDMLKIITLVGGTVGGYISFAGAHRLLDAGISGQASLPQVTRSSVTGILITSVMRFVLFFAALGVVSHGGQLSSNNPAGSVFQIAAGDLGYKFFGFVMWCAAITSVVGASYTSVTFFKTLHPAIDKNQRVIISLFIIASSLIFVALGNPVALLIVAGAVNGLILPVALSVILIASTKAKIVGTYKHPIWMQAVGWLIVFFMLYMGVVGILQSFSKLF